MSGPGLWPSLFAVAGVLLAATACGRLVARALLPPGREWSLERTGWSIAAGLLLLTANVCLGFALGLRPGWLSFLVLAAIAVFLAHRFAVPPTSVPVRDPRPAGALSWILGAATAAGFLIYLIWSLEEPLASNDFFAIWGLKGKSIYGDAAIPGRLFDWPQYAYSNPAYPIGLPLLYAGVAFLLGRWDDHAMSLLCPLFQGATLLVLAGWLRRRGASRTVSLAATALLANFAFLYSPWMTGGMAEVPASFTFLLVGVAFCDSLDATDAGCRRRLALATLAAAAVKNEGVFLAAAALGLLLLRSARRRERPSPRIAAALLLPAAGSFLLHRLVLGKHELRALDFGLLWKPGFARLLGQALREAFGQLAVPNWAPLAALLFLLLFTRRIPASGFLLALAGSSLALYLVLPAFCTYGPAWLVHWTVGRIAAALAPLAAAGIAAGWGFRPGGPVSS